MVTHNPVKCPNCGMIVLRDEKDLAFCVLYNDIKCQNCGSIVIQANNIIY